MYKNIVFDMGNVLLKFEPQKYVEELGLVDEKEKTLVYNAVKECFFIDDLSINIYGAMETGMDGFVFHNDVEELREEFKLRGIL